MTRALSLLIVLLLPVSLLADSNDLERRLEKAKNTKTPAGVQSTSDPEQSMRSEFQPSAPSDKTTQLYAGRGITNVIASEIFVIGGILYESNKFYFMESGKDTQNSSMFDEVRTILTSLRASDSTIQALNDYATCRLKAPFGKPWESWTEVEKAYWTEGECGWSQLVFGTIPAELKPNPEAYYFYWLGVDSTRLGVHVPYQLQNLGANIQDLGNEITNGIDGFYFASTDPVNQKVTPEVAAAVRTIAEMKGKMEGAGLSSQALNQISKAALQVISIAGDNKLIE